MKKIIYFLIGLGFLLCTSLAFAIEVNFQWGASTGKVDGYRIYCASIQGGPYLNKIYEGNATVLNCTKSLIEDHEYYLVCRAFNGYGESGDSNEVQWLCELPGIPGALYWTIDLVELMKNLGAEQIEFVSK